MSQRWDLNPRPHPYQGCALPTELHRLLLVILSERPGSNRRHSAWKADALPTELLPLLKRNTRFLKLSISGYRLRDLVIIAQVAKKVLKFVGRAGFEPAKT